MTEQVQTPQPNASPAPAQETANNNFTVPDAYKDRGWSEKIKSPDDLWKTLDNAQSLIGKRPAGVPSQDASEEEWNKFYAAAGRPEKPDAYQFSDVEGLPEGFDPAPYKQKAATILHQAGLNQKQADAVWKMFISEELKAAGESKGNSEKQQAELDAEFDKIVSETFGDKYDAAAKTTQEMIAKHVPQNLIGVYDQIAENPKVLAAVIAAVNGAAQEIAEVKKKYGAEDKLSSGNATGAQSIDEVRKELAGLRTSKEARDFTHPDHKKTVERINALSDTVKRHFAQ